MKVTHNGPSSLSRYLKNKQYIYNFDYGLHFTFKTKSILLFEFDLTPKGYNNIQRILARFYKHIETIDVE